jgi:hypothetical protein
MDAMTGSNAIGDATNDGVTVEYNRYDGRENFYVEKSGVRYGPFSREEIENPTALSAICTNLKISPHTFDSYLRKDFLDIPDNDEFEATNTRDPSKPVTCVCAVEARGNSVFVYFLEFDVRLDFPNRELRDEFQKTWTRFVGMQVRSIRMSQGNPPSFHARLMGHCNRHDHSHPFLPWELEGQPSKGNRPIHLLRR